MALQPLIPDDPNQQQENPLIAQLRALSSQQAPAAPTQAMGGAPSLPTSTLKPLVTSPKLAQEQKLQNSISQFENPTKPQGFWQNLRHDAATVGNIAGDVALGERTMSGIPGTAAYHQALHDRNVQELAGLQQGDRADENQASENTLRAAETGEAQAKTKALENPADKPDAAEFQQTDHGLMRIDKVTGKAEPVTYNGQPLKPAEKETKEESPTIELQRKIQAAEQSGDMATAHTLQQQLKDLNPQAEQRFAFSVGQAGEKEGKQDHALRAETVKAYQPTLDSAERMNVMTESYEKAVKDHDQQAMLNLLANHLGMTMGLQKGARMTRDIIREAQQSAPWLQSMEAKFDKDGYLSGVNLTPNQMRQMVALGQSRFGEDAKKSRATAEYIGAKDDGPARTPSSATIRYYVAQANGDADKAKKLAADDGWVIK